MKTQTKTTRRKRPQKLVAVFGNFNGAQSYGQLWRSLLARHRRNQSFARAFGDLRGENAQTRKEITEIRKLANRIATQP